MDVQDLRSYLTDGRLIRGSIVAFFALVALVMAVRESESINFGRMSYFRTPAIAVIPTPEWVEPASDANVIFAGETISRRLESGFDNWSFEARAGERIDLTLVLPGEHDPEFDPAIEIFTPDGQPLLQFNEAGAGEPERLTGLLLPQTGEYTMWLSDTNFSYSGDYALTLTPYSLKPTHPLRLGVGEALQHQLNVGDLNMWLFSGAAGRRVSVTLLPFRQFDEDFQPHIEIYDPLGSLVAEGQASPDGNPIILREILLTMDGNYTVWVNDAGYDSAGNYLLSIQQLGEKAPVVDG